jgi:large subunit ribosomal protein L18
MITIVVLAIEEETELIEKERRIKMKLNKKRRLEGKTNYKKRLILLKGDYLRLVVRKTNKYITLQIVKSEDAKDKVLYSASTKNLLKYKWPIEKTGSLKSLSAAYLAGLLLGKKARELKQEIILDSGLIPNTKGSRVYAAVKGISDSGIAIKYDEKAMPNEEKIKNKYEFFEKVKESIEIK